MTIEQLQYYKNTYDCFDGISSDKFEAICDELIAHKKLEEQLGCPLDIVFKLVNQNELYYQFYNELQHWTSIKVDLRKKVVWYCKQVGGHYACSQPLSNYGKTFWLRKDKSE
jgi:hypothetical protein